LRRPCYQNGLISESMMSNTQLYLSVGLPVLAILISLLIQLQAVHTLQASVDKWMDGFDKRMDGFERRMDGFERRMERFEDLLMDMRTTFVKDYGERIVRLESSVFRS
jgi:divalent metal cation (Fe/Co/Zn/Cd) transporter